ncbi:MAG: hypothetical protein QXH40_01210 [Candidatus Bathyarchaeia archaeon]
MVKVVTRYWRIVAGHPKQKEDRIEPKSIILGDWLRNDYVSIGWEDPKQISRRRFDEMKIGDKIVVTTDKHIWAIGEIAGNLYEKEEGELYPYRKDVIWYKITRLSYDNFPASLRNKLRNPHTVMELDKNDWETILAYLT